MSLSVFKNQRCERNGFTLVEIVIAMMIGAVILGSVITLMGFGISMVTSNIGYSAAQRGALSTTEMLSKEIATANEVEIISGDIFSDPDERHVKEIVDGWHYVALDSSLKEARHLYQEDGELVNEKIPGSEDIENMRFDTEEFPAHLNGGGRLLRVYVNAAYGGADEIKKADLGRTMLVHAASGVMGESDAAGDKFPAPPGGGRTLRYRLEDPLKPELGLRGSKNTGKPAGKATFDYDEDDTWGSIENFNYFTELDARLELPPNLLKTVQKSGEDVIFTWIIADPTIFEHDVVNSAADKNPEAILAYLETRVPDYLEEEEGWNLLKEKYKINDIVDAEGNLPEETIAELIDDPFNMGADDMTKGFQLMDVMKGKLADEDAGIFELEMEIVDGREQKFNLGAAVNGLALAYDY
ncbi:MAG: prepilin-type N-terminal cleavage/methylation domain-containing protein, partial [Synergistaceae bacterium]|nr:prepilin-type N-terminal cleavage/methylation domain-containing protein [Synergistaceae bacterium]